MWYAWILLALTVCVCVCERERERERENYARAFPTHTSDFRYKKSRAPTGRFPTWPVILVELYGL